MPQIGILVAFGIGAGVIALVAVWVAVDAQGERTPFDRITNDVRRAQVYWFSTLLAVTVVVLAFTLPRMPNTFARSTQPWPEGSAALIDVVGHQYWWSVRPQTIPLANLIRLNLTSQDVNHGFAIYDKDDRLVGQVQVMPGYTNSLVLRLDEPGTYLIRCLELCGPGHAGMIGAFCIGSCN